MGQEQGLGTTRTYGPICMEARAGRSYLALPQQEERTFFKVTTTRLAFCEAFTHMAS